MNLKNYKLWFFVLTLFLSLSFSSNSFASSMFVYDDFVDGLFLKYESVAFNKTVDVSSNYILPLTSRSSEPYKFINYSSEKVQQIDKLGQEFKNILNGSFGDGGSWLVLQHKDNKPSCNYSGCNGSMWTYELFYHESSRVRINKSGNIATFYDDNGSVKLTSVKFAFNSHTTGNYGNVVFDSEIPIVTSMSERTVSSVVINSEHAVFLANFYNSDELKLPSWITLKIDAPFLNITSSANTYRVNFEVLENSRLGSVGNPDDVEFREALKVDLEVKNADVGLMLLKSRLDYHLGGLNSAFVELPGAKSFNITLKACYYLPDDKKHLIPSVVHRLGCRYSNLNFDLSKDNSFDVLEGHNESDGSVFNSFDTKNTEFGFGTLLTMFNFTSINPFNAIFLLFTNSNNCVNIPIVAGMLGSNQTRMCPWFSSTVRGIVTPVIGLSSLMLIFGFFIRWLGWGTDNQSIEYGNTWKIGKGK